MPNGKTTAERFSAAREAGHFAAEITPVEIKGRNGTELFATDEAPGLNAGAAALVVAERSFAEKAGVEAVARLAGYGVGAVEPGLFGLGPVPAVKRALDKAGWILGDVERFEINEAFATVPLAIIKELGLPEDIVNVDGGAVAHGHPIGATGAILTTRLIHSLRRDGLKKGIVTLCIGGGQGIALALEVI